jgi:hypothetical protein
MLRMVLPTNLECCNDRQCQAKLQAKNTKQSVAQNLSLLGKHLIQIRRNSHTTLR